MENKKSRERLWYIDYLRILATVAVIIIHIAAQNWSAVGIDSLEWKVFNVFDSAVRWAVPIFAMISGILFLDNDKPLGMKKLYLKNILRIVTAFIFWSGFYALVHYLEGVGIVTATLAFVIGEYHMWFLFVIIGLYIVTPVLREITKSKKIIEYCLVFEILFIIVFPLALTLLTWIDHPHIAVLNSELQTIVGCLNTFFSLGFVFYYLLGYYLGKYEISVNVRRILYVLGVIGLVATIFLTDWYSNKTGQGETWFYGEFSFNVLMMAVGIFVFAKYELSRLKPSEKVLRFVSRFSKYSFGMYLVHPLILAKLDSWFGLNTLTFHPVLSVSFMLIILTVASYLISAVIHRVPILNKYIV